MINVYIRGRSCIESVRERLISGRVLSFFYFEPFFALFLGLPLFMPFTSICGFSSSR
jgi:hypothetical protein